MVDINSQDERLNAAMELFYYAYRAFTAQPDTLLAARGWGRVHHRVLYFVGREPGLSVNTLIARLGVSKQALHGPLRDLQEADLIVATPAEQDKRVRCLSLSPAGATLENEISSSQRVLLATVFQDNGSDAAQGWQRIMTALAAHDQSVSICPNRRPPA
ncbi:MarR family winged helix-turn-helix transcriptional regulator [Chitiniphilus eburneus]|uniref:MarR family transcriptional regulator n=1 Tax=Chitiniphilus eburneus TaxID=2571148 RepID=A0A4U0PID4_9NEIS|nr:MarR family transcriptional regulator [Chitiniphilus eburneus]TJZ67763.1 MarR family transcriptional regulator [Chitiniphilus eburneus]